MESLWSLHFDKNGNAGDVQPIPVPKLNDPIVAKKRPNYVHLNPWPRAKLKLRKVHYKKYFWLVYANFLSKIAK